jgi:hypothetical protein
MIRPALGILLVLVVVGCAETFDATTLGVPAALATEAGRPVEGARFSVTQRSVYGLWGVATIKSPSLRKALAAQLADGSSVVGLKIRSRSTLPDVLITVLTVGLIVPRSVTFEGTVTK